MNQYGRAITSANYVCESSGTSRQTTGPNHLNWQLTVNVSVNRFPPYSTASGEVCGGGYTPFFHILGAAGLDCFAAEQLDNCAESRTPLSARSKRWAESFSRDNMAFTQAITMAQDCECNGLFTTTTRLPCRWTVIQEQSNRHSSTCVQINNRYKSKEKFLWQQTQVLAYQS